MTGAIGSDLPECKGIASDAPASKFESKLELLSAEKFLDEVVEID